MTEEQLKAYILEISTFGNIPISSKNCGIGCIYCKVHTDPVLKRFPSLPDITEEDLYYGFQFVDKESEYLRLGAGVLVAPKTDPYLHPDIYKFIEITAKQFPKKKITTVSTGSYIEESKIDFLKSIPNFGIDLSLVTMQVERETIVPRATRARIMYLLKNATLNKVTLMFTGDLDTLKKDLDLVYSFDLHKKAKEILVRRIEYTKYSDDSLNSTALRSIQNYETCVSFLKINYPEVIFTVPDLKDVFRGGNNEYFLQAEERIKFVKVRIRNESNRLIHILCSSSVYDYFSIQFISNSNIKVHLIKNQLYGGSVTVAGLLNHNDILNQFTNCSENDIVILPKEMYNSELQDILGNQFSTLQTKYKAEIWIM
jgi:hypothetical protein